MLQCFAASDLNKWKSQSWTRRLQSIGHKIYRHGHQLTMIQLHMWALIIGVIGGIFIYAYQKLLILLLELIWRIIPNFLYHDLHILSDKFPPYNYIWIVQLIASTILGISLVICKRISFLRTPGNVDDAISKLHSRGFIGAHHFIPMFVLSMLSLVSGASVGPESPMVILGGCIGGKIARWLKQDLQHCRALTLCGMSATLSTFFGLPLGGALFVLELPHRWGLQYYESISPAIMSSIIGVMVKKALLGEELGGTLIYPPIGGLHVIHMLQGIVLGVIGALIATFWAITTYYLKKNIQKIHFKWPVFGTISITMLAGVLGAVIGMVYPLTLFWGENQMQTIFGRGDPQPPYYPEYIKSCLGHWDVIKYPLDASSYFQIGFAKIISTAIQIAAGYPAGVIYPLFFIGAVWGYGVALVTNWYPTVCILGIMGSVEVAITRCPWATTIVLLQTQGGFYIEEKDELNSSFTGKKPFQQTYYLSILSVLLISIVTSLVLTRYMVYYSEQRNRISHPFSVSRTNRRNEQGPVADNNTIINNDGYTYVEPDTDITSGDEPKYVGDVIFTEGVSSDQEEFGVSASYF